MPFFKICILLNILCIVLVYGRARYDKEITIDYYGRGILRHTRVSLNCELDLHKEYCRFKCSKNSAVCIGGNCYCVKGDNEMLGLMEGKNLDDSEDISTKESVEESSYLQKYPLDTNNYNENQRRHHIAHFCPDLEIARQCIRKCMAKGKPAFCGKDHVCYCSHNTKRPGIDKELNVTAMYAQFKDLYDKYFGAPQQSKEVEDYHNDIKDASSAAEDRGEAQENPGNSDDQLNVDTEVNQETPDNTDDDNTQVTDNEAPPEENIQENTDDTNDQENPSETNDQNGEEEIPAEDNAGDAPAADEEQ